MNKYHNAIWLLLFIILCLVISNDTLFLVFLFPVAETTYHIFKNDKMIETIDLLAFIIPSLLYIMFKIIIFPLIYKKANKSGMVFCVLEKIKLSKSLKFIVFVGIILGNIIFFKSLKLYKIEGFGGLILSYLSLLIYYFFINKTCKIIDVSYDFTQDTPGYWNNFWTNKDGLGSSNIDPDTKSKTLQSYHQILWSKKLPNGQYMDLVKKENKYGYYLSWNNFNFSSDSLINEYRWKKLKSLIKKLENKIPNYNEWQEEYIRKTYTIGGMLIFPQRKWGINQSRGCNPRIYDRFDLTLECIRKYYSDEPSPLYETLKQDSEFFNLFVNFKGYVDFFLLQDLVTKNYTTIKFFLGNGNFEDNPLPQNIEEYFILKEKSIEFIDKRNKRINESVNR